MDGEKLLLLYNWHSIRSIQNANIKQWGKKEEKKVSTNVQYA